MANGETVECTRSGSIAALKKELEKLCSQVGCDYKLKKIIAALDKFS